MMRCGLLIFLWWALAAVAQAGQLLAVKAEPEFDTLRLSLELSAPTQFRYSLLDKPDRLVVELTATEASSGFNPATVKASPVSSLRQSANGKNLKLVFELDSSALVKAYKMRAGQRQPDRVVLELSGFKAMGASKSPGADKASLTDKQPAEGKEPLGVKEPAAQREPAAQKEIVGQKEATGQKDPSALKEPSAKKELSTKKESPGDKPKASKELANKPVDTELAKAEKPAPPPQATASQANPSPEQESASVRQSPRQESPRQESQPPIRGRKIIVALDAGHGGKDTGAVGARGVREKDVVLSIARELANLLNQDGRYKVVMTRAGDQFIPLKGRRDKARKLKADVFISIHADAFVNPLAKGASVFALSQRGATSEMARFLAEHENSSDLLGSVGGVSLDDKDEVLAGVLVDLSMTATLANSLDLGGRVLKELGRMAQLHNRSVEQAGFVVLKSPDVPSILVETGFISNPDEAAKLNNPAYRQKLAQAIFRGVNSYFATQGPAIAQSSNADASADLRPAEPRVAEPAAAAITAVRPDTPKIDPRADSRGRPIAAQPKTTGPKPAAAKTQHHRVEKGDTLEKIARRYGVSQKAIMQANGMPNGTVKLGQTLLIPVP